MKNLVHQVVMQLIFAWLIQKVILIFFKFSVSPLHMVNSHFLKIRIRQIFLFPEEGRKRQNKEVSEKIQGNSLDTTVLIRALITLPLQDTELGGSQVQIQPG